LLNPFLQETIAIISCSSSSRPNFADNVHLVITAIDAAIPGAYTEVEIPQSAALTGNALAAKVRPP